MIIDESNIEEMRASLPIDQAQEIEPGCKTWPIFYDGGQRGQMTIWPNGRGAIFLGGDSEWGDMADDLLTTDEGVVYNSWGTRIDEEYRLAPCACGSREICCGDDEIGYCIVHCPYAPHGKTRAAEINE